MSENKTPVQMFLDSVLLEAESAASEKITKAMHLFMQCDDIYKGIILRELRPKLPLTGKSLREKFDTLDLLDSLDDLIYDMQYDISARAEDAKLAAAQPDNGKGEV